MQLNLAVAEADQSKLAAGEARMRRAHAALIAALGQRHWQVAAASTMLADLLIDAGSYREANRLSTEAGEIFAESLPPGHVWAARADSARAASLAGLGDRETAQPLLVASHQEIVKALGTGSRAGRISARRQRPRVRE